MPEHATITNCKNCKTKILTTRHNHITGLTTNIPLKAEPKTLTPQQATALILLGNRTYWHTNRHGHHYLATNTTNTTKWIQQFRTKDKWNLLPHHYCKRKQPGTRLKLPTPPKPTTNTTPNNTPWGAQPPCTPHPNPPF